MHLNKTLPRWLSFERMSPALLSGLILFAASFFTDIILDWIGTPGQARFFNYLAIGFIGALLILFFLSASYENQVYARAKERMQLIAEMNYRIRGALSLIEQSATLDDRDERLRGVDEAVRRIDVVLTDFLPTAGTAAVPHSSFLH
ncbi:MAG: hypothetical protein WBE21_07270 [Candidatus Acidiferrales bacterium]|jgi:hypothetical protein|nr:hypothetical protein [Candidatus Acidoferrales bacterium]